MKFSSVISCWSYVPTGLHGTRQKNCLAKMKTHRHMLSSVEEWDWRVWGISDAASGRLQLVKVCLNLNRRLSTSVFKNLFRLKNPVYPVIMKLSIAQHWCWCIFLSVPAYCDSYLCVDFVASMLARIRWGVSLVQGFGLLQCPSYHRLVDEFCLVI